MLNINSRIPSLNTLEKVASNFKNKKKEKEQKKSYFVIQITIIQLTFAKFKRIPKMNLIITLCGSLLFKSLEILSIT